MNTSESGCVQAACDSINCKCCAISHSPEPLNMPKIRKQPCNWLCCRTAGYHREEPAGPAWWQCQAGSTHAQDTSRSYAACQGLVHWHRLHFLLPHAPHPNNTLPSNLRQTASMNTLQESQGHCPKSTGHTVPQAVWTTGQPPRP